MMAVSPVAADVSELAGRHDALSADIARAESELAGMDAARSAARTALDGMRAQIGAHLGDGARTARAGQRYAGRGNVSAIDSWGDDSSWGSIRCSRSARGSAPSWHGSTMRHPRSAPSWPAGVPSWPGWSSALWAALAAETEPAAELVPDVAPPAAVPVPELAAEPAPVPAVRIARTWRRRPAHVARPAPIARPRATAPPVWSWPTAAPAVRPAPVAPAVTAGRPLAVWSSPRVRYADPAAGRLLGLLLAAVLCLLAGSLVTFALGGPGWFGGLLSFALFMTAAAVANVSNGRIAATINGRL